MCSGVALMNGEGLLAPSKPAWLVLPAPQRREVEFPLSLHLPSLHTLEFCFSQYWFFNVRLMERFVLVSVFYQLLTLCCQLFPPASGCTLCFCNITDFSELEGVQQICHSSCMKSWKNLPLSDTWMVKETLLELFVCFFTLKASFPSLLNPICILEHKSKHFFALKNLQTESFLSQIHNSDDDEQNIRVYAKTMKCPLTSSLKQRQTPADVDCN